MVHDKAHISTTDPINVIPYCSWTVAKVIAAPDLTVMQGRPEGIPQPCERPILATMLDQDHVCTFQLLQPSPSLEARLRRLMGTHGGLLLRDGLASRYGGTNHSDGLAMTVSAKMAPRCIRGGGTILKLEGHDLLWWAPATGETWNTGTRVSPF